MKKTVTDGLIVFFIPPENIITGGILSIFSIAQESKRFSHVHHSEVVVSVFPGHESYSKNSFIKEHPPILSFEEVIQRFPRPSKLIMHVPEYAANWIASDLLKYQSYLEKVSSVQLNVLNQNIEMMPTPANTARLFSVADTVSQSTAHNRYCTQKLADTYQIPTHLMSIYIDPAAYDRRDYDQKENIIVLSADENDYKRPIIDSLKAELPDYQVIIIQNMPYDQYKRTVARAKFLITFGEGFDSYYFESALSGAIAFAVYNEQFFPSKDYLTVPGIYRDYQTMLKKVVTDIKAYDKAARFKKIADDNAKRVGDLYSFEKYLANIKKFYEQNYTYTPNRADFTTYMHDVMYTQETEKEVIIQDKHKELLEKDQLIALKNEELNQRDVALQAKDAELLAKDATLQGILNSRSWKITKPLRKISGSR